MPPQTINPPELIERYDLVVPSDDMVLEGLTPDHETVETSTVDPLEGLSIDRIRLRSSRRLR